MAGWESVSQWAPGRCKFSADGAIDRAAPATTGRPGPRDLATLDLRRHMVAQGGDNSTFASSILRQLYVRHAQACRDSESHRVAHVIQDVRHAKGGDIA